MVKNCTTFFVLVVLFSSSAVFADQLTLQEKVIAEFIELCDMAAAKLVIEPAPADRFYIDSYAVRGMLVGYDMTNRPQYFAAAKHWSDRMLENQPKMIPADGYYMSYHRRPGEDEGDWYVADCGTIAMAVLATALRCDSDNEKNKYIDSVERFAALVKKDFTGPDGAMTPGFWRMDKQWWCSTATTVALYYQLYAATGKHVYKKDADRAVDWLLDWQYDDVVPKAEMVFEKQWPTVLFYSTEGWSYGLPYYEVKSERQKRVYDRLTATMTFLVRNQTADGMWGMDTNIWAGAKQCGMGLPVLIYLNKVRDKTVRNIEWLADDGKIMTFEQMLQQVADNHLDGLVTISRNSRKYTHAAVYTLATMAEYLNPGAIYEKTRKESHLRVIEESQLRDIAEKIKSAANN